MTKPSRSPEAFAKALQAYPAELAKNMHASLERAGQRWHRTMLKRFRGESPIFPERSTYDHLTSRGGRLRRSLGVQMSPRNSTRVWMTLSSRGTSYAASQEFGAVITPKNAKWLWIPMKANTTAAGKTRKTPRLLMQDKGNLIFRKMQGGNAMLVLWDKGKWSNRTSSSRSGGSVSNRSSNLLAMFYLKKKVTIPGPSTTGAKSRLGFFDTWAAGASDARKDFAASMHRAAIRALRQAK